MMESIRYRYFKFNAENSDNNPEGGSVLNFQQGVFIKVPITRGNTIRHVREFKSL
jgi:hypothetical protein